MLISVKLCNICNVVTSNGSATTVFFSFCWLFLSSNYGVKWGRACCMICCVVRLTNRLVSGNDRQHAIFCGDGSRHLVQRTPSLTFACVCVLSWPAVSPVVINNNKQTNKRAASVPKRDSRGGGVAGCARRRPSVAACARSRACAPRR